MPRWTRFSLDSMRLETENDRRFADCLPPLEPGPNPGEFLTTRILKFRCMGS